MRHALSTLGHPAAADQGLWRYDAVVNAELKQARCVLLQLAFWARLGMGLWVGSTLQTLAALVGAGWAAVLSPRQELMLIPARPTRSISPPACLP